MHWTYTLPLNFYVDIHLNYRPASAVTKAVITHSKTGWESAIAFYTCIFSVNSSDGNSCASWRSFLVLSSWGLYSISIFAYVLCICIAASLLLFFIQGHLYKKYLSDFQSLQKQSFSSITSIIILVNFFRTFFVHICIIWDPFTPLALLQKNIPENASAALRFYKSQSRKEEKKVSYVSIVNLFQAVSGVSVIP